MDIVQDSPKLCECGCGQPTRLAAKSQPRFGIIKGCPLRFVHGHNLSHARPAQSRFWIYVEKSPDPGGCWNWIGATTHGYGRFTIDDQTYGTHRLAWEWAHGPIPPGKLVCHRCDNRRCVHAECVVPDCAHTREAPGCTSHMYLGTYQENRQDAHERGREILPMPQPGERNRAAKLTATQVEAIRTQYAIGTVTLRQLADMYGVSASAIWLIVHRKKWVHI